MRRNFLAILNIKFTNFLLTIFKKSCIIYYAVDFAVILKYYKFSVTEKVNMIKGYEIERKFLVKLPDTDTLDVKRKVSITQTYLKNGENNAQRRVRRIAEGENIIYTYTEKLFITAVTRKEMEYEIDESEYSRLIVQACEEYSPINKVRYCFDYRNQLFELDVYPFSDSLAIMELELESEEQEIIFPDNVTVLKEVTDNSDYSNASLATAGAFPEQYI